MATYMHMRGVNRVTELQSSLLEIRRVVNRHNFMWVVYWIAMHVPLLFWLVYAVSGYPMYEDPRALIHTPWLISQWVVVVLMAGLCAWAFHFKADHPWVRRVVRETGGMGINRVDQELVELAALRKE